MTLLTNVIFPDLKTLQYRGAKLLLDYIW